MRRTPNIIVFTVFASLLITGAGFTATNAMEETTVTGQVWAQSWDENYEATAAIIMTQEGYEYWVVDNAAGKELFKLDLERVKAIGSLSKIDNGKNAISVNSYEVIQDSQEKTN
jgi:hypothetical protein